MKAEQKGAIRVGTSNIVVPGNKQSFPEAYRLKSRLNYYSSMFNTLEVNSSFYKIPMKTTFEKWALDVPDDFKFSLKLWRELTHVKDLKADLNNIDIFLKAASGIGGKKGCLLIQFPGKISMEYYQHVEQMIAKLSECNRDENWPIAIEFRNPTWYVSETFELLDEYGASMVLHDMPKAKNDQLNKTAAFVYVRYHGPNGDYKDSYSDASLKGRSDFMKDWLSEGKDVYAYFNNTIGSAFANAMTLNAMMK